MKLNFYLKKNNSKEAAIILYIRAGKTQKGHDGKFIKNTVTINTGEAIKPSLWNQKSQQVRRGAVHETEVNTKLALMRSKAQRVWSELTSSAKADIPFSVMESAMRKALQVKIINDNKQNDFFEAFELFVQAKATDAQPATIQKFRTIINHLKKFSTDKHYNITFETLNFVFYDKFLLYLIHTARMTNNTPYKILRLI